MSRASHRPTHPRFASAALLCASALACSTRAAPPSSAPPGPEPIAPTLPASTPLASTPLAAAPARCDGSRPTAAAPLPALPAAPALTVPSGFVLEAIAQVPGARELAALPNGDLLVGTLGQSVMLVPSAESEANPGAPQLFTTLLDAPLNGVAFDSKSCTIYIAAQHGLYSIPYSDAQTSAPSGERIAAVRAGPVAPHSDGDVHRTSSVALAGGAVYMGVGSSCNACTEADSTRATVLQLSPDSTRLSLRATRFRNAIALAQNPDTKTLWAGGAGQDSLIAGHPYEFFDPLSLRPGIADYGWPDCEENQHAYTPGADCSHTVTPLLVFPAYSTLIGAAFYPTNLNGRFAFPTSQRGLYITLHGSWHVTGGSYAAAPRVVFVPMKGDAPALPVNWSDPSAQWKEFLGGMQAPDGTTRLARATGVAVGAKGSLFVADDQGGLIFRIRPKP